MKRRSVVVTGMGIVSPLGNDVERFWRALSSGTSGIVALDGDLGMLPPGIGGRLPGDETLGTSAGCVSTAADSACRAAGLDVFAGDPRRIGVSLGANLRTPPIRALARLLNGGCDGEASETVQEGTWMDGVFPQGATVRVANDHRAKGPCFSPVGACAAGSLALLSACRAIEQGQADVMIAGGGGVNLDPLTLTGYSLLGILTSGERGPAASSRPFDRAGDGQVLSDGAAVVVLEALEHAERRGATPLARFAGYGCSAEARPLASPDRTGAGAARAFGRALTDAEPIASRIDYVCAHAVGIPEVDAGESSAIRNAFGRRASELAVSSIKSMIGNPVAAGGPMQLIASILAIRDGRVPPTINLDDPDPEHGLDCTPHHAVERPVRAALSSTLAFGGQNAAIVVEPIGGGGGR